MKTVQLKSERFTKPSNGLRGAQTNKRQKNKFRDFLTPNSCFTRGTPFALFNCCQREANETERKRPVNNGHLKEA